MTHTADSAFLIVQDNWEPILQAWFMKIALSNITAPARNGNTESFFRGFQFVSRRRGILKLRGCWEKSWSNRGPLGVVLGILKSRLEPPGQ